MEDYYKVLGLEPGALPQAVKRAYFSLVRKYSPETDPDKFREIREAYEQLQKPEEQDRLVFPEPREPWAVRMLQQIREYQREGRKDLVRDACEEAWRKFPEERQFLYLQAIAQRQAGNTGKAVKSCEQLVKAEPGNRWFWRELAVSYMERGYTQKAFGAFEKAYELGCRDNDFILMYSLECNEYGEYNTGIKILFELVRSNKRWKREQMLEVVEAYAGLLAMNAKVKKSCFTDIMESLLQFIKTYSVYLEEYIQHLINCIGLFCVREGYEPEEFRLVEQLISAVEKACRSEDSRRLAKELREYYMFTRIEIDERLAPEIGRYLETAFITESESLRKYAITDTKLCMLEKRQELLPQFEILRQEYPEAYEAVREFAEQLKAGKNLAYLKANLLKQYISLSNYHEGGYYFEEYPQEQVRISGRVLHDGMSDTPYVRDSKKIGRNDPCPCGSGKKYKQCCGRKQ